MTELICLLNPTFSMSCLFSDIVFTMETLPIERSSRSRMFSELSCKSRVKEYQSFLGLAGIEGLDVSVLLENEQGEWLDCKTSLLKCTVKPGAD